MFSEEIPSISELFDLLEDDPFWHTIKECYSFIFDIHIKIVNNILLKIKDYKHELDDLVEYYLAEFIVGTLRLFSSMILLCIYGRGKDSCILFRPLIENLAETKYFLYTKRRRAIRKIKLYRLLNEKRRYEFYQENYQNKIIENGYIILHQYIIEADKNLKEKIEKGLVDYNEKEIKKMETNIQSNRSWHGKHIKQLFKELNMHDLIENYNVASGIIHIRDVALNFEAEDYYSKYLTILVSKLILLHLYDFKKMFKEILNEEIEKIIQAIYNKVMEEFLNMAMKDDDFKGHFVKIKPS